MINILILTCGTNAAYHFTKIIKEKFSSDFRLIGADINKEHLVPSSVFLDKFYQVPPFKASNYYETILNICKIEQVNYILPIFDFDQILFNGNNIDLIQLGIQSFAISSDAIKIYKDKNSMDDFLRQNNLPIPRKYNIEEVQSNVQYIIKPINGSGSLGVEKLMGNEIKRKTNIENFIIQEICSEPEITLECFYLNKKMSSVARERIDSKAGVCTKTRVFNSPQLEEIAYRFASLFNCPKCFNLQFMKNAKQQYVITDVNLRLAGGMSLSYVAGWDEASAIANFMLNRSDNAIFNSIPNIIQEQYVVRAYTDIVTKKAKQVVAFDLDGTILDSRERHRIVLDKILEKNNVKINTQDLIHFKRMGKNNIEYLTSKGIEYKMALCIQQEWIKNIEEPEFLKFDKLYIDTNSILQEYLIDYDLVLITARSNKEACRAQLQNLGINNFFKKIYIVEPCKKTPELKAEILKKEKAILMIGDTEVDKLASELANVQFKPVFHGFRNKEYIA